MDGEALDDFHGIDDVRNGILGNPVIHAGFDTRMAVILKVHLYFPFSHSLILIFAIADS